MGEANRRNGRWNANERAVTREPSTGQMRLLQRRLDAAANGRIVIGAGMSKEVAKRVIAKHAVFGMGYGATAQTDEVFGEANPADDISERCEAARLKARRSESARKAAATRARNKLNPMRAKP